MLNESKMVDKILVFVLVLGGVGEVALAAYAIHLKMYPIAGIGLMTLLGIGLLLYGLYREGRKATKFKKPGPYDYNHKEKT